MDFVLRFMHKTLSRAFDLLERVRPDVIKLHLHSSLADKDVWLFEDLLRQAAQQACLIIVRKVDQLQAFHKLRELADDRLLFAAQGNAIDIARSTLIAAVVKSSPKFQVKSGLGDKHRQGCC